MSKHHLFRRIMSVMLVLCLSLSMIPLSVNAEENISTIPFSIDGTYYAVDMKFEGDQLYCRADQWAKAAGCLWVLNSDYQKVLFYYEDPVVLVSYDDQSYIVDGDDVWVPFFDVATQTGVYFPKVSGNQIYGYREKPLAVFYKDMDRMFAVSQYRTTDMIIELGNIWALIDSASRSYAILSSLSLKGFLDAVSGKMDQDMYDKAFIDILKTDETVLGALAGAGEALERPGKIVNLLQESLDEDGVLVEVLKKMDFSENEIREIVWDLSQDAYGSKTLNDLSDFYEANQITHFLDMLKMVDNMTVSLEADIHTVTAMQKVFENSDSVRMRQAAQKAVGARLGNKVHTAGMYSLEFVGNILWDQTVEKLDELCEETLGTTSLQKLVAEAFVWVFDKSLSLTETTDAIMYSDVYSQVQLELVNYYFCHRDDDASDNGLMMHSVALLYLRSCLAAWQMFEYDESLAGPIDNATSLITAEITNLMKYTEESLLQSGTGEETEQAVIDLVKRFENITPVVIKLTWNGTYEDGEYMELYPHISGTFSDGTDFAMYADVAVLDTTGGETQSYTLDEPIYYDGSLIATVDRSNADKGSIVVYLYRYDGFLNFDVEDDGYGAHMWESNIQDSGARATITLPNNSQPIEYDLTSGIYRSYTGYWFWGPFALDHGEIADYDASWILWQSGTRKPGNLADGRYPVSFSPADLVENSGDLYLDFTYYSYYMHDKAEILNLKPGDTVSYCGEDILVESVDIRSWDYEGRRITKVYVNEYDAAFETYIWDSDKMIDVETQVDYACYFEVDTVTLKVAKSMSLYDQSHNANPGMAAVEIPYNELVDYFYESYYGGLEIATTAVIENNEIVSIEHKWIP